MSSEDKSQIIEAVIEALKNNPELLKPIAQNLSKTSDTVTGFINTLLTPVELFNFVVKEHKEKFMSSYHDNLNKIPEEQRIEPKIEIIGPIIDNLKYKITEETLRETYAKLLASASNSSYSNEPLLSYNFVLNQLSPKEIQVLKYLYNKREVPVAHIIAKKTNFDPKHIALENLKDICPKDFQHIFLIDNIIDNPFNELKDEFLVVILSNFIRLGLIQTSYTEIAMETSIYEYVKNSSIFKQLKNSIEKDSEFEYPNLDFRKGILRITSFGISFCEIIFEQNNSTT